MSEDQLPIEVNAVIFCDDIRRENNGKEILIGVYNGIRVERFPVQMALCIWMQYTPKVLGETQAKFRVIGDHGEEFFNSAGKMTIRNLNVASTSLPPMLAALQIPGDLTFQMRLGDGEWTTLKKISVEAAKPNEPAQSSLPTETARETA